MGDLLAAPAAEEDPPAPATDAGGDAAPASAAKEEAAAAPAADVAEEAKAAAPAAAAADSAPAAAPAAAPSTWDNFLALPAWVRIPIQGCFGSVLVCCGLFTCCCCCILLLIITAILLSDFKPPFRCDEHYTLDDRGLFQDGTGSMPGVFQRDYSTYGIFVAFGDNAVANTAEPLSAYASNDSFAVPRSGSSFAFHSGLVWPMTPGEPAVGASNCGGSLWPYVADLLVAAGTYDAVIIGIAGAEDKTMNGLLTGHAYTELSGKYTEMHDVYGKVDAVLVHAGEAGNRLGSISWGPSFSGVMTQLQTDMPPGVSDSPQYLIAHTSGCPPELDVEETIRGQQNATRDMSGNCHDGPDADGFVGDLCGRDGAQPCRMVPGLADQCNFTQPGLYSYGRAWVQKIQAWKVGSSGPASFSLAEKSNSGGVWGAGSTPRTSTGTTHRGGSERHHHSSTRPKEVAGAAGRPTPARKTGIRNSKIPRPNSKKAKSIPAASSRSIPKALNSYEPTHDGDEHEIVVVDGPAPADADHAAAGVKKSQLLRRGSSFLEDSTQARILDPGGTSWSAVVLPSNDID